MKRSSCGNSATSANGRPALLHLARRCGRRVATWSRLPSRRRPEVLKAMILPSPMAFRMLVEDAALSDRQMQQCRCSCPASSDARLARSQASFAMNGVGRHQVVCQSAAAAHVAGRSTRGAAAMTMRGCVPVWSVAYGPGGAQFCSSCGAAMARDEEEAGRVRKVVTVVFSDLAGSTGLGERLDPESLTLVMGLYFERTRAVLERHGGTVQKFIGDAVMAVFGIPVVREDDALRAVRAAAELRTALAELNTELVRDHGVSLELRTGVNTGEILAGDPAAAQALALGDTVNVAARLEQVASSGEVLLGHATWALVRDAVEVTRHGSAHPEGEERAGGCVAAGEGQPGRAWAGPTARPADGRARGGADQAGPVGRGGRRVALVPPRHGGGAGWCRQVPPGRGGAR